MYFYSKIQRGTLLTANYKGKPAAFALYAKDFYCRNKTVITIYHFGVAPELQKKGLGSLMAKKLEDLIRTEKDWEAVAVDVDSANTSAHGWYTRLGFQERKRERIGHRNMIKMIRRRDFSPEEFESQDLASSESFSVD